MVYKTGSSDFFFCLPHYHILGEVEEIKKWIFFFVVVSDMGLSLFCFLSQGELEV